MKHRKELRRFSKRERRAGQYLSASLLNSPAFRRQFAHALLFIAPLLWSANYIVARLAPGVIEPHQLALVRWFLAFLIMLPFAWRELIREPVQWLREWPMMLILGALGMWICGAFVYIGGRTTSAVNIGLLYALAPVLIAVISARLFDDRLRGLQVVGLLLALAGMLLIVAKGSVQNLIGVRFVTGDLWIITAVLCWTAYSILLRREASALGPFARLTIICAAGVIVLVPFTAIEIAVLGLPSDWTSAIGLGLIAAVLPGFGAYQAYSYMQRELGAARTGLVLYLGPLYAAIVAWIILGETPAWFHAAGACLILPGMFLATRTSAKQNTVKAMATPPVSLPPTQSKAKAQR